MTLISVPRRNHSLRSGSTAGSNQTLRRVTPAGAAGGADGSTACSRCTSVAPDRRGAGDAGDIAHRRPGKIADPHTDRVARGEPDAPVVAHVLAGPGLGGAPHARGERILQSEGECARAAIGKDVGDDVACASAEHASRLRRRRLPCVARERIGSARPRRRSPAPDRRWSATAASRRRRPARAQRRRTRHRA